MELIDRQAAIDAIRASAQKYTGFMEMEMYTDDDAVEAIKALPSAQPKIIYCGDCKYKDDGIDEDGIPFLKCLNGRSYGGTRINDFCSWAERKENGSDL